ncbi:MAG: Asp-tRNA(Asn)/Glu-tRNA(Gln) amidotransferase subunit GatC [Gammaproteobacteria bacterium]
MKLTTDEVADIAHLARLDIAAEDVPGYCSTLSSILDFVAQLERVNAEIEPMAHPEDIAQRLRADQITGLIDRDRFQQNAEAVDAGLYLVPQVIE